MGIIDDYAKRFANIPLSQEGTAGVGQWIVNELQKALPIVAAEAVHNGDNEPGYQGKSWRLSGEYIEAEFSNVNEVVRFAKSAVPDSYWHGPTTYMVSVYIVFLRRLFRRPTRRFQNIYNAEHMQALFAKLQKELEMVGFTVSYQPPYFNDYHNVIRNSYSLYAKKEISDEQALAVEWQKPEPPTAFD